MRAYPLYEALELTAVALYRVPEVTTITSWRRQEEIHNDAHARPGDGITKGAENAGYLHSSRLNGLRVTPT